jgi:hypothetical protein
MAKTSIKLRLRTSKKYKNGIFDPSNFYSASLTELRKIKSENMDKPYLTGIDKNSVLRGHILDLKGDRKTCVYYRLGQRLRLTNYEMKRVLYLLFKRGKIRFRKRYSQIEFIEA